MATPRPARHDPVDSVKKTLPALEPSTGEIVSQPYGFFNVMVSFHGYRAVQRIDLPCDSRDYGQAGVIEIASEGQILVSSTTERRSAGASGKGGAKSPSPRKGRKASAKDEGHVSQVLRTVYQRAVDEDIPAEMLDLLSKLD